MLKQGERAGSSVHRCPALAHINHTFSLDKFIVASLFPSRALPRSGSDGKKFMETTNLHSQPLVF